ncbi:MAG: tyrosine-type recombinase/integrase [Cytophagales bacterium]
MTELINRFFDYLKHEKRYSEHTLISYQNDLAKFCQFLQKSQIKESIELTNRNTIRSFVLTQKESGLKNSTINRNIACLKSFFTFLHKKGIINQNPASDILSLKKAKRIPVVVGENEIENIISENGDHLEFPDLRDKVVFELFYGTGIRLSELTQLKNNNFDSHFKRLKVLGKGKKERIIPIHSNLQKLLEKYLIEKKKLGFDEPEKTFIVTNEGNNCYKMQVQRIVKKMLSKTKNRLEKQSPHVLRHTFATHLLSNNADITSIKDLLGHSSLASTQVYTQTDVERLKVAFEKAHPKS